MFSSNTTQVSSGGYQISRSLRFNSADSAYLNRTPASAGNRKTWTLSAWIKRGSVSTNQYFLSNLDTGGASGLGVQFVNDGTLHIFDYGASNYVYELQTTAVFRDPSAWYHFVIAFDTTQATSSNRVKLYVNNVQQTSFSISSYPSLNYDGYWNNTSLATVSRAGGLSTQYFDGYVTETNFIDGQALTPSSFGETNAQTGVWQPKAYSGSYGTNGFYINFSDNSNTTAATLGKDYSGNSNNWTPNNFSVTAGIGNDSLVDSPTSYGTTDTGVGGEIRGNYCTLNPLDNGGATVTNGNLDWDSASNQGTKASFYVSTGQYYWEITSTEANLIGEHGVAPASKSVTGGDAWPGSSTGGWGFSNNSGNKSFNGTQTNITSAGTNGDVMMYALNMDTGKIWFGRNGTWFGSGNPSSGTNEAFSGLTGTLSPMTGVGGAAAGSVSYNFGQRPFAYTAPSGFKALCTQNLPTPTIGATSTTLANLYFTPVTYTGTGAARSVTVGFQPDFVWIKDRTSAEWHRLYDAVRGATKELFSNTTNAEVTDANGLTAFDSNGFSVGTLNAVNKSADALVAWNWKANGSGSTNTSGSITSTVSANTTSGFSVVTYTGTGSAATIGHGLGVAPSMLIFKSRSNGSENWNVYHKSLGASTNILLNSTIAAFTDAAFLNATAPTSTVLSVGGAGSTGTNQGSGTYVCYAFAEVAGYSKFGSYTGNGSSDGPFVFTGFRPAYVLIKKSNAAEYWTVMDSARGPYNVNKPYLSPNTSNAEGSSYTVVDFTSNGFKLRTSDTTWNANGDTYIFAAFAESPFKYSLAR